MNSNYEIEKLLYKYKAYKNSDYLKNDKSFKLTNDYEIKSLYEYFLDYKREENSSKSDVSSFEKTLTKLPELGEVEVYESVETSENRKLNSLKEEMGLNDEKEQKLLEYSVISLNKENKEEELVIDKDGNDLGILTYDEKGNPSFKISPNLKKLINERLEKSNVRTFVQEQTIQEEFYLKNINSLIKAIEEGMIVPESVKSAGERAAKAQNIKNGQYSSLDSTKTIILTPEEIQNKLKEEEVLKKQLEDDEKDHERSITEKTVDKDEKDIEDKEDEKNREENKNIPENKIDEIDKICNKEDYSKDEIKSVLIIKDPSTLADCTENSKINRKGSELTIVQFSSVFGKEKYTIIQDGVELGGEQHDRAFRDLIAPLKATSGVYKRVEDNENYVDYTDSSRKFKSMQLKRIPIDMTLEEKDNFRERLEIDLEKLEYVREVQPDNKALIDKLEIIVEDDFVKMGLTPPQSIKEDANDIQAEPEEIEEASIEDVEEIDDDFDEVGRRRRTH